MQASNLQQEANLISRMERMPLNKALLTLVGLLSWCWVMEAFDLGMIGQVVAVLKKIWDLDASTLGLLGSCSTAGVVIGTASAGFLTDRFGRKRILLWGVFIFTFFTLIGSLYENLAWIVTMRFIGGLGGRGRLPSPLPDAFRNRPGQAPRHPRLHLQRHPDGLLSASDALRLVGHQQFFAGRRVARAVHRGRAPHRHDLFPAPLAPRIPRAG